MTSSRYKDEHPILVVDALNLFMRHFVVNPAMSDAGVHVGGWIGFLKSLRILVERMAPSHVLVIWEGGGSPRRRAIFSDYKSNRRPQKLNRFYEDDIPDTVENRDHQIRLIVESLKCVPIRQIYVADCEADDVIGYIARHKFADNKIIIVSSDKDLYQLLSDRVAQWSPGQKKLITPIDVKQKFNIPVSNFCLARAFIGDPSDSIPGVTGAGFKSLTRLFPDLAQREVTIDEVIEVAQNKSEKKRATKLSKNVAISKSLVDRNWRLMYLDIINLSAEQIERIEYLVELQEYTRNKMKLYKQMRREGVTTFDVDSFFSKMSVLARKDDDGI